MENGLYPLGGDMTEGWVFIIAVVVVFIVVADAVQRSSYLDKLKKQDYTWYRNQYPEAMRNGRIVCRQCQSRAIRVRGLMNRTYMREHFCGECGATLYYSPEG